MSEPNDSPEKKIPQAESPISTGEIVSNLKSSVEELEIRCRILDTQRGYFLRQLTEESVHLAKSEKREMKLGETVAELRHQIEEGQELLNHAREEARSANSMVKLHQSRMGVLLEFIKMILDEDLVAQFPLPEELNYNNISNWVSLTSAALEARELDATNAEETSDNVNSGEPDSFEFPLIGDEMPENTPVDIELPVLTNQVNDTDS